MAKELSEKEYQRHLAKEHSISPFSTYLREIVYGGIDGIVTTFAVVAGFAGAQTPVGQAQLPVLTVLLFGFANLFADASSMGLGNFLSVRANQDVYRKEQEKERREVKESRKFEISETIHILKVKGFTEKQAQDLAAIYAENEDYWVDFMMREELEISNPLDENPFITGVTTALSFVSFGAIPLLPYIFLKHTDVDLFAIAIACACTALLLLGFLRWKVTKSHIARSLGETILLGGLSASIAYFVGTFFRI